MVIVGAGFGGFFAARHLTRAPVDVLIIDKNNYHTFIPLLYQVAAAELDPVEIAYPIRALARRHANISFVMDEVTGLDLPRRQVVARNGVFPYDYLILAAGSVTNFFGLPGVADHAFGLKDLPEAVALRNHVLGCFEAAARELPGEGRRARLTFVVVGGGPTGVEYCGTLSELVWQTLRQDYPEVPFEEVRILLLEATDRLLPSLPPALGAYAQKVLARKGVEVWLGAMVTGADGHRVHLRDQPSIATRTLVWTAGVEANPLAAALGVPLAKGGRVQVTDTLQVPGFPEVYVIGDMAYVESDGRPVPQVAPAAIQQARTAAENIRRHLAGEPLQPFRYVDKGSMVTVGRGRGIAVMAGRAVKGFGAWLAWLAVHIARLIGFRNRLYVLAAWAWSYLFQDRIRLIIRGPEPKNFFGKK
ncbi:MAG TPA: NAD(P)/FAD-dependent oxidoreductase [Sphingobacteriaceae bacterium]|nr:NAD(P)/FAD-dependent oxidoreductase [Sphingobacteriaceae bacterium]